MSFDVTVANAPFVVEREQDESADLAQEPASPERGSLREGSRTGREPGPA